jgi:hypothetical protein
MNKKSRKRAFFVCVAICLLYLCVTFRLSEKMHMQRTTDGARTPSKGTILPVASAGAEEKRPGPEKLAPVPTPAVASVVVPSEGAGIEPSLLISVPVVCYAIKEGWLEKEGLIFSKKDAYNNVTWKKPIEILRDRDEDGLRYIVTAIGNKRVVEFIKKEGINVGSDLSPDNLILGKGYSVSVELLISLYDRYVANEYDDIFPFSLKHAGIIKKGSGFELAKGKEVSKDNRRPAEPEWMMPNLANLPIKSAIEKLSVHTSRIKVYGNGYVMSQSPRPFERLKGELECTIQGRTTSQ